MVGGRLTTSNKSVLAAMPFERWARKLLRGHARMKGRLKSEVDVPVGAAQIAFLAGEVDVALDFTGGDDPRIDTLDARGIGADGRAVAIHVRSGSVTVDGQGRGVAEAGPIARTLMERLWDVALDARAEPDGDVVINLGHGVLVDVPGGVLLTIRGSSHGPPSDLVLADPLVVGFGGEGLKLGHDAFRFLSRLADVRLSGATLHPDGRVALEGRATRAIDLAVKGGLHKASGRLSELVRTSPRFNKVRAFLKPGAAR